jgi:hypothetical protein
MRPRAGRGLLRGIAEVLPPHNWRNVVSHALPLSFKGRREPNRNTRAKRSRQEIREHARNHLEFRNRLSLPKTRAQGRTSSSILVSERADAAGVFGAIADALRKRRRNHLQVIRNDPFEATSGIAIRLSRNRSSARTPALCGAVRR